MAHVGRFYKLQFRRDLAYVSNNVDAYPECFGITLAPLDGSLGHVLSGALYQLVNLLKDDQPPMVWRNDSIVVGGTPLSIVATAVTPQELANVTWTFEVNHAVTGANYFRLSPTQALGTLSFHTWDFASEVPSHQTSEVHALGTKVFSGLSAQGWNVYNP